MHNVQEYHSILSTITLLNMLNVWVGILLTCGQHMSSPLVSVGFVLLDLQFYMNVLLIVVCPFVFFLLAIVLSVLLLRYTDYDCPFGIFKLFLNVCIALLKGTMWAHKTSLTSSVFVPGFQWGMCFSRSVLQMTVYSFSSGHCIDIQLLITAM